MANLTRHLRKVAPLDPSAMNIQEARKIWATYRTRNKWGAVAPLLSPPSSNVKFAKTRAKVYGLSLAPANVSGNNVCSYSTPECRKGCVAFSGKGGLPKIIAARQLKTRFLAAEPQAFVTILAHEIGQAWLLYGETLRVRLNTFSDLPWEKIAPALFDLGSPLAAVQFYDYTKYPFGTRVTPANYTLTYSVSEKTHENMPANILQQGHNVAVIFTTKRGQDLPAFYKGKPVIDGDKSDDRTLDPAGVVVGLRAKGIMRRGTWGMVKSTQEAT